MAKQKYPEHEIIIITQPGDYQNKNIQIQYKNNLIKFNINQVRRYSSPGLV